MGCYIAVFSWVEVFPLGGKQKFTWLGKEKHEMFSKVPSQLCRMSKSQMEETLISWDTERRYSGPVQLSEKVPGLLLLWVIICVGVRVLLKLVWISYCKQLLLPTISSLLFIFLLVTVIQILVHQVGLWWRSGYFDLLWVSRWTCVCCISPWKVCHTRVMKGTNTTICYNNCKYSCTKGCYFQFHK